MQLKQVFAGILTFSTITMGTWTVASFQAFLAQEAFALDTPVEKAPTQEAIPAETIEINQKTKLVSGGMVEKGSEGDRNITSGQEALDSQPTSALPSCAFITYSGSSGYISVQTSGTRTVAWGITMVPISLSGGRWDADTYLNGKKTTSGIHRTVASPYIPHGSIQAKKGQRFSVVATLVSAANGRTYTNVPNSCIVP